MMSWGEMYEQRMVTECLLNHIRPSPSEAHYTIYRGMNSELVMLEKRSRLASPALCKAFVFLYGGVSCLESLGL